MFNPQALGRTGKPDVDGNYYDSSGRKIDLREDLRGLKAFLGQQKLEKVAQKVVPEYDATFVNSKNGSGKNSLFENVKLQKIVDDYGPDSKYKTKVEFWRIQPDVKDFGINWESLKLWSPDGKPDGKPNAKMPGEKEFIFTMYKVSTWKGKSLLLGKAVDSRQDYSYNCYSLVFGASESKKFGGISGPFWMMNGLKAPGIDGIEDLLRESYKEVRMVEMQKGDLVVFRQSDGVVVHAAVISRVDWP